MDVEQKEIVKKAGFIVSPDFYTRPRATYYGWDAQGKVKVMPNLPIDGASLKFYLQKGYVLDSKDLKPQSVVLSTQEGFTCQDCGKVLSTKLALAGHSRTHKNKIAVGGK